VWTLRTPAMGSQGQSTDLCPTCSALLCGGGGGANGIRPLNQRGGT
jgi:hypothetical protein